MKLYTIAVIVMFGISAIAAAGSSKSTKSLKTVKSKIYTWKPQSKEERPPNRKKKAAIEHVWDDLCVDKIHYDCSRLPPRRIDPKKK